MLAIVSDIHDNLVNLKKFCDYVNKNKISKIICLGDVASNETIHFLATNFTKDIYLVRGNMDYFDENYVKTFPNIHYFGAMGQLEVNGKQSAFTHIPEDLLKINHAQYDYLFYGHTHKPWKENKKNIVMLNPGTLAGMFFKSTFAIWDETKDEFTLILTDDL